jgi:2-dehydropantoate 2-reductase
MSGAGMNVAVVGAGAVGCYYGFLLAKAGHAVTLIGRPALVEAVGASGLVLERAAGTDSVPVRATAEGAGVAGADLVLVCVKSGDTESAGAMIAPHLGPATTVLSLQNGVDNAERLAGVLGRPVVPVAVYVATAMAGPGRVRHNGRGDLILGASTASEAIAAAFTAAGIPSTVSERALDALWGKLIMNCAYNALSALTQLPYGRLIQGEGVVASMTDVVQECVAVAGAAGVSVPTDVFDSVLALSVAMADQRSSTAQDLARGRPSEIDHLNGYVVRQGAALGIPTPANRMLHTLVKLAERRDGADTGSG